MNNTKILLVGGGTHARYVMQIIEKTGRYSIVGIIDTFLPIGTIVNSYEVVGNISQLKDIAKKYDTNAFVIAIGDNYVRKFMYETIKNELPGARFENIVQTIRV